ncbi:hypothetical protein [Cryptosporangium japonicum]|uniref:Uncharacterized protein n=1 Tax=Cryptosporangium japonicum TaxID=80872 RepID=A0ABP3EW80_9ACTN
MSTDPLETKFAAFRATTTLSGPGAPEARATVRRQRRRAVVVGAAALVLVILGAGAAIAGIGHEPQRLVPAEAPSSPSPSSPAPPPTDDPRRYLSDDGAALPDARIDLRTKTFSTCSGPQLQFHDGHAVGLYQGAPTRYEFPPDRGGGLTADLDGDGNREYLVTIRCAATSRPVDQIFVLRGDPTTGDFTAIAGIHGDAVIEGEQRYTRPTMEIDGDTVTIEHPADGEPGVWRWRYQDGDMVRVSR